MSARRRRLLGVGVGAALVVGAGCAYQLLVAVEVLELGVLPGEGPPLEELFFLLPVYVLVLGGLGLLLAASHRRLAAALASTPGVRLLGPVAVAFVLLHSAAFDPYYAPSLVRFWTNAGVSWLASLAAFAVLATYFVARRPGSLAVVATGVTMLASAALAIGMGLH